MFSQHNLDNIYKIRDFLNSQNIEFEERIDNYEIVNKLNESLTSQILVFSLKNLQNGKNIEICYVDSSQFPLDTSKWGKGYCGTTSTFFSKISKDNYDKDIRTIFIKDYEMDEKTEFKDTDKTTVKDYKRKWEVLKSTISVACGKIKYRIYARDCEVKEVHASEATTFLKKYCFYGPRGATLTLGLYLKKDVRGLKKGTLVFISSFGMNYYGNRSRKDTPNIEVIRVGTMINAQVIGGSSKLLKHFIDNYPSLTVRRGKENVTIPVEKIVYYVDADHWDGRGMKDLGYKFREWSMVGFHNFALDDIDIPELKVKKGQMFQRKPLIHKKIIELMKEHKVISIGTAGTIIYEINKNEYLQTHVFS